mmetsp:Transcript_33684/g.54062  ORF Transcript_33684/g.54062 Transcript_33684/m.54062 type:complete len:203 (-) Transcript_33684:1652-2260(-)
MVGLRLGTPLGSCATLGVQQGPRCRRYRRWGRDPLALFFFWALFCRGPSCWPLAAQPTTRLHAPPPPSRSRRRPCALPSRRLMSPSQPCQQRRRPPCAPPPCCAPQIPQGRGAPHACVFLVPPRAPPPHPRRSPCPARPAHRALPECACAASPPAASRSRRLLPLLRWVSVSSSQPALRACSSFSPHDQSRAEHSGATTRTS